MLIAAMILIVSCSTSPPLIDLKEHEVIGIIEFTAPDDGDLGAHVTRKFIEAIRKDQGMVAIMELGSEHDVLASIGAQSLDSEALRAIAEKHDLRTIFTGELELTKVAPGVSVSPSIEAVRVSAETEAHVSARMVDAVRGVSLWSGSGRAVEDIGSVGLTGGTVRSFDINNPNRVLEKLLDRAIKKAVKDFQAG
jgi:hypothetical protein